MAKKHVIAVIAGAAVGVAYISIASCKVSKLAGLESALPQSLAAITWVFNLALMVDLLKFEPSQFGDLIASRNTLIGGTFLICFLAPWYMINSLLLFLA